MSEPAAATAIYAAGITLFGISTGLDPAILVAGLAGGLWAQSYQPQTSIFRRIPAIAMSAIIAGYLTPAVAVSAAQYIPFRIPNIHLPSAVLIGLTCHRVLGPAFMRLAAKKIIAGGSTP